jgi:hypothetical protein
MLGGTLDLPLPVATLARRGNNAKGPKERHDTACFALEASLRLAVAGPFSPDGSRVITGDLDGRAVMHTLLTVLPIARMVTSPPPLIGMARSDSGTPQPAGS